MPRSSHVVTSADSSTRSAPRARSATPGGARVLRLDGEQPPHDVRRGAFSRHEQLRRGAAPAQLGDPHPATTSR